MVTNITSPLASLAAPRTLLQLPSHRVARVSAGEGHSNRRGAGAKGKEGATVTAGVTGGERVAVTPAIPAPGAECPPAPAGERSATHRCSLQFR